MSRILNLLILSAFSTSADASLAALKALDKAASAEELASYCAPQVSCSYTMGSAAFGPEDMSPADCVQKAQTAQAALLGDSYMMASFNPEPLTEAVSGTQGVSTFAMSVCKQQGDGSCIAGTTLTMEITSTYVFDDQDKVVSMTFTVEPAAASLFLSANEAVARRNAMPVIGILITTFLLSALSIGCYQLGKKRGQAKVSGGYTSLLNA